MTRNQEISDRKGWQGQSTEVIGVASNTHASHAPPPPDTDPEAAVASTATEPQSSQGNPLGLFRFALRWHWTFLLIMLVSGGVGLISFALLFKLPGVPNCPGTFWPTASASMRLYCAQLAANKETAEDLLKAIELIEALPQDHPLREEIDTLTEQWSLDILKIGEAKFQAGKLDEAKAIANRIPTKSKASKLGQARIQRWQGIWAKAEGIYQKAEQQLRESHWTVAFREAVKLTSLDNKYWAAVKYDQIVDQISIARDDSQKLDKARDFSQSSSIEDLLAGIKEAEKISNKSYAYKEAQDLIAAAGKKLVERARNRLERGDWQGVLEIANKLPDSVKLPEVKSDLIALANAISASSSGTVSDLQSAIAAAEKLGNGRPLYSEAQQLSNRWQREIDDLARLDQAKTTASSGLVPDLRDAITEVQKIPKGNPRYSEAQADAGRWQSKIEATEDQPYLDRAKQIASLGGASGLQDAIQEARRITAGRALYPQAQEKIREWTSALEKIEDQPYLDQARTLANSGSLPAAITAAQQIKPGRALSREAQNNIRQWQAEIDGQQRLQESYETASPGTPEAISNAIRTARRVPSSAKVRGDADIAANRWSYQLLAMAQDRSSFNVTEAIAIAKMIPSGTEAYQSAQSQIQEWQKNLEAIPEPIPIPPTDPQ